MPEKLDSGRMVWTFGLWTLGSWTTGSLDSGLLDLGRLYALTMALTRRLDSG